MVFDQGSQTVMVIIALNSTCTLNLHSMFKSHKFATVSFTDSTVMKLSYEF
jgi:hypothetical protein